MSERISDAVIRQLTTAGENEDGYSAAHLMADIPLNQWCDMIKRVEKLNQDDINNHSYSPPLAVHFSDDIQGTKETVTFWANRHFEAQERIASVTEDWAKK